MVAYLCRRYHFSASHRLHTHALSDEQNRETYGKCNHPFGHGHNYIVEVSFRGPVDERTGMVTNLADLDDFAREKLQEKFGLTNLNLLDHFSSTVPTTENLTLVLHKIFAAYPFAELDRIHVEETSNNSFDYQETSGLRR